MNTELALPTTGDVSQWNDQEKAIVEAAGLRSEEHTSELQSRHVP